MDPEKIATQPEDVHMHDETEADSREAIESVTPSEASEVSGPPTAAHDDASRSDVRRAIALESESKDDDRIDRLTDAMFGLDRDDLAAMLNARVRLDLDVIGDGDLFDMFRTWRYCVDELVKLVASVAAEDRHDMTHLKRLEVLVATMWEFVDDEDDEDDDDSESTT